MVDISREKEMAEIAMDGEYQKWEKFNRMRTAYSALTTTDWNTLAAATGLDGVTKAQGVAFMSARENEALVALTEAVNVWRLTP